MTGGIALQVLASTLYNAFDPDRIKAAAADEKAANPSLTDEAAREKSEQKLQDEAVKPFNGTLNQYLVSARKAHDQYVAENLDVVTRSEWAVSDQKACETLVRDFASYLHRNKNEVEALQIYFEQPQRRREVTLDMISEFLKKMQADNAPFDVGMVWASYHHLGIAEARTFDGSREVAMLSLIRYVAGIDTKVVPFATVVDANYKAWVFKWNNAHPGRKLTEEDAEFMRHVRDHYKTSLHIAKEDFGLIPFNEYGGYFRLKQIFGAETKAVIEELNEALAA